MVALIPTPGAVVVAEALLALAISLALDMADADDAENEESADDNEAALEACADDKEESKDEGGAVIGIGMRTEPDVEALKEVIVGPSAEDGPVPDDDSADTPVAELEAGTSLERLSIEDEVVGKIGKRVNADVEFVPSLDELSEVGSGRMTIPVDETELTLELELELDRLVVGVT